MSGYGQRRRTIETNPCPREKHAEEKEGEEEDGKKKATNLWLKMEKKGKKGEEKEKRFVSPLE